MGVKKIISLYRAMLVKNLRESTAYKLDFLLGVLAHLTPVVALLMVTVANLFFSFGLKFYHSSGGGK